MATALHAIDMIDSYFFKCAPGTIASFRFKACDSRSIIHFVNALLLDKLYKMLQLVIIATILGYAVLVMKLRFRRRDSIASKCRYHNRHSLAHMTVDDASEIQLQLAELEFPFTFSTSIFFALFKVDHSSALLMMS